MDKFDDFTVYNSDSESDIWAEFTNYFYKRYLDDYDSSEEKDLSNKYSGVIYFD